MSLDCACNIGKLVGRLSIPDDSCYIGKLTGKLTIPDYVCLPTEPDKPTVPQPPGPDITNIPEDYQITPKAFKEQIVTTAGQCLEYNLLVKAVPYYETTNGSNGITVCIAEDV